MASLDKQSANSNSRHAQQIADNLLENGKKIAQDLYEKGTSKLDDRHMRAYTEQLTKKIRENPIKSVLIASGIGFILSTLLKK